MAFLQGLVNIHNAIFGFIHTITRDWFLGLSARLIFSSVLMYYFLNSACTKLEGACTNISIGINYIPFPNSLFPSAGSYAQIVPPIANSYNFDVSAIPLFPWKIIVVMGTYAEFILPFLILLGLFTRLGSLAFIGFIAVMTYVDINFLSADPETIGAFFDRIEKSAILDQRLLWLAPLLTLVVIGPGKVSLDYLIGLAFRKK